MNAKRKRHVTRVVFAATGLAILVTAYVTLYESAHLPPARGTIRDPAGSPVAGAIVFGVQQVVEKQTWNFHGFSRRRCARIDAATTDVDGRFDFDGGRTSIPEGWDFETAETQYHVVAEGYRSTTVGGSLDLPGIGRRPAEQATAPTGMIDAVMQPASDDLFVSPWLADALQNCEAMGADLAPARQGFAKIFERANLESESLHQRKWLNIIGNVALRSQFSADELPALSQPPTNEQLRALLSGDTETAKAQIVFREAVIANDIDRLRDLLKAGIDVNFDDGYRRSRLGLALEHESHDAYLLLHENGARWRKGEAEQLLYLLARRGDATGVELLANEGVRADVPVEGGRSVAFMEAATAGHADVLRLLLSHDLVADIDATYGGKGNALQKAFVRGHIEAFRVLLAAGASPEINDKYGRSLFENAVLSCPEFAFAMLEHGVIVQSNSRGRSLLTNAIHRDNRALAEAMLKAGFSPAAANGTTPLAAAAGKGWQDMVHDMLQHPDTPPGSKAWWNALWTTVARTPAVFDYLLASYDGPLSDPPPEYGCIICRAASKGTVDIAERLLARGLSVDVRASDGETALMHAARKGQLEMVQFLLESGADASLVDNSGTSALAYASDGGNRERRDARWGYGMRASPSMAEPREKVVTMKPLDLEDRPSHEASSDAVTVAVRSAVTRAGSVRSVSPQDCLPVVPEIVELLVGEGVNPDSVDENGWAALMRAAACGEKQVAQILLEHGADRKLKSQEGKTAADIAAEANHTELAAILR